MARVGREFPLQCPTRGGAAADKPRRDDLRVVDDHEVAGPENLREVADVPMCERSVGPADDEQPCGRRATPGRSVPTAGGNRRDSRRSREQRTTGAMKDRGWENRSGVGHGVTDMESSSIHTSVMPAEVLSFLTVEPGMRVVDGTLGGGGPSDAGTGNAI